MKDFQIGDRERASFRIFAELLERVRDRADAAVEEVAARIPAFAQILATMDEETRAAESARSQALEKAALVEGDWQPYLENLRVAGETYAALDVPLQDWFALVNAYRSVIIDEALRSTDPERARAALEGLGLHLDIALSMIGRSYLATKEAVILQQKAELMRYVRELQRSNKELDDFAFVASHDLKAPLRDISTLASWVVEDGGDTLDDECRGHLALIGERIARMERLLDDLLAYSRAGRVAAKAESFQVREAIEQAASVSIPVTGFELVVTGDVATVRTARAPLELVLRNLMTNAVKHRDGDSGRIEVTIEDEGADVTIEVADDGPGIPPEFHERIFRMFQTLRPRDEVEGSGMGLAIVKKLVEARGGELSLRSAAGEGTAIRFTWPKHHGGDA